MDLIRPTSKGVERTTAIYGEGTTPVETKHEPMKTDDERVDQNCNNGSGGSADDEPGHRDDHESIVYWTVDERPAIRDLTTRQRLIDAGWRSGDSIELGRAFPGATAAQVSAEAGVTTGSFFHHFPNAQSFANAMIKDMVESSSGTTIAELAALATSRNGSPMVDLREMIRSHLTSLWDRYRHSESEQTRFRAQMRLWSHNRSTYEDDGTEKPISEGVASIYRRVESRALEMWTPALELSGLEITPPFTARSLTTVAFAIFEGLVIRYEVDPEAVPPSLWGDACVALISGMTRPAGARVRLSDDSYELEHYREPRSPQARSGAQRRRETRSRIVAAATGMFTDGWESISATDVAHAAGVSTQTVLNLFTSVRAVAAATFAPQAQELYRQALGRSSEDPVNGLKGALTDLTVRCRAAPEVTRALHAERLASFIDRGRSLSEMDVRLEVPISGAIGLWLGRMGLTGDRGLALSTTLADFVLTNSIISDGTTDEIIDMAFRLIPDDIASGKLARQ